MYTSISIYKPALVFIFCDRKNEKRKLFYIQIIHNNEHTEQVGNSSLNYMIRELMMYNTISIRYKKAQTESNFICSTTIKVLLQNNYLFIH